MTTPTPGGLAVGAASALAALAAWRLEWDELWVVAGAGAAALALGWVACQVVAPLHGTREATVARVTAGDALPVRLRLRTTGRRGVRRQPALDRLGDDAVEVTLPAVPGRSERTIEYLVPTRRRGHMALGPVVVDEGDPLGLFRSVAEVTAAATIIVHPRQHPLSLDPSGRRRDLDGLRTDLASGSITFHALRDYVLGDDLRRVHWRSSARTGSLVVRQDVDPSEPRTVLFVDLDPTVWTSDDHLDQGLEVAASIVRASVLAGLPLTLVDGAGRALDAGSDGVAALDALAASVRGERIAGGNRSPLPGIDSQGVAAGAAVVVTGERSRADDLVDDLRLVADRCIGAAVTPGGGTGVHPVGRGGLVLTAPDAVALCEGWSRWTR